MPSFEEYELFHASTEKLSERRQSSSQTFLTINTAIFTVLAFLAKDAGFSGWPLVFVGLPLFMVGIVVCYIWQRILSQYKELSSWRYEQLRKMEQGIKGSYEMYSKEEETFYQARQGKTKFGFSNLELRLPQLFMSLYVIYGVGLVVATMMGLR